MFQEEYDPDGGYSSILANNGGLTIVKMILHAVLLLFLTPLGFNQALSWPEGKKRAADLDSCIGQINTKAMNFLPLRTLSYGHAYGKVLRLSLDQYRLQVKTNAIPPRTILILDRIDTELDPPIVAGIIVHQQLPAGDIHVSRMTQILNIPFIRLSHTDSDKLISGTSYTIESLSGKTIFNEIRAGTQLPARPKATIPAAHDRSMMFPISPSEALTLPFHIVGQKYKELCIATETEALASQFAKIGFSPGYYERFIDQILPGKKISFRAYIQQTMNDIALSTDESFKVSKLEVIQKYFMILPAPCMVDDNPQGRSIFDEIQSHCDLAFKGHDTSYGYSVRSNNELEGLLGAGAYASFTVTELEMGIRRYWASGYTYRAFNIRDFLNLDEANHSMPLFIHPYIGGEAVNGVAKLYYNENDKQVLDLGFVSGQDNRATSPNMDSPFEARTITETALGLRLNWLSKKSILTRSQVAGVTKLFHLARASMKSVGDELNLFPTSIGFEWILKSPFERDRDPHPIILQANINMNSEYNFRVLAGDIDRDKTNHAPRENALWPIKGFNKSGVETLEQFMLEFYWKHRLNLDTRRVKYMYFTVINFQNEDFFLLWEHQTHAQAMTGLRRELQQHFTIRYQGYAHFHFSKNGSKIYKINLSHSGRTSLFGDGLKKQEYIQLIKKFKPNHILLRDKVKRTQIIFKSNRVNPIFYFDY